MIFPGKFNWIKLYGKPDTAEGLSHLASEPLWIPEDKLEWKAVEERQPFIIERKLKKRKCEDIKKSLCSALDQGLPFLGLHLISGFKITGKPKTKEVISYSHRQSCLTCKMFFFFKPLK